MMLFFYNKYPQMLEYNMFKNIRTFPNLFWEINSKAVRFTLGDNGINISYGLR